MLMEGGGPSCSSEGPQGDEPLTVPAARRVLSPSCINGSLPVADQINTDDCTRCVFDRLIAADM